MSSRSPLGRVETCSRIALLSDTPFVQPNGFRAPGQALCERCAGGRHAIGAMRVAVGRRSRHMTLQLCRTTRQTARGQKTVCLQGLFTTTVVRRPSWPCDADTAAVANPPSEGRFTVSEIFLQKIRRNSAANGHRALLEALRGRSTAVYLGHDRRGWCFTAAEHSVMVLGPPRSGKTTVAHHPQHPRCHRRRRLHVDQARRHRRHGRHAPEVGQCLVFDPSGSI